jgi:hypothetical protein
MTMFPQESHEQVGGCTTNLTQTTQVQTSTSGSPCGPYHRLLKEASCHWTQFFILCPTRSRATCRYVRVESHRLSHARTHEARYLAFRALCQRPSATTPYRQYSAPVQNRQEVVHLVIARILYRDLQLHTRYG